MNRGKAEDDGRVRANQFHRTCRGIGDGMQAKGDQTQHGKPQRRLQCGSTGSSRETGRAVWGGGEARSTGEIG